MKIVAMSLQMCLVIPWKETQSKHTRVQVAEPIRGPKAGPRPTQGGTGDFPQLRPEMDWIWASICSQQQTSGLKKLQKKRLVAGCLATNHKPL